MLEFTQGKADLPKIDGIILIKGGIDGEKKMSLISNFLKRLIRLRETRWLPNGRRMRKNQRNLNKMLRKINQNKKK